jgi:hypothetical protein
VPYIRVIALLGEVPRGFHGGDTERLRSEVPVVLRQGVSVKGTGIGNCTSEINKTLHSKICDLFFHSVI